MDLQPSQPLFRILNFKEAGIGVFPEGERERNLKYYS